MNSSSYVKSIGAEKETLDRCEWVHAHLRNWETLSTWSSCRPRGKAPRWWRAAAVRLTRLVSVHREGLCRQRLRRREGRHGHRDRRRDRAQKPRSGRLRRPTAPLGRGALLRLDQPQPATGKGLRGHHRLGPRLPLRRLRHAPRPQIGPSRMTFETDSKSPSSAAADERQLSFSICGGVPSINSVRRINPSLSG